MIIDNKYTLPYTVPSGFVDGSYRYNPMGIVTAAQDLAAGHYSSAGVFIPQLQQIGLTWVISKQHFEIYEYPLWMDHLFLQTWAQKPKGLLCMRDFAYFYSHDGKKSSIEKAFSDYAEAEKSGCYEVSATAFEKRGQLCIRGSSCWIIMNTETGQPVKPSEKTMGSLTYNDECLEGRVFAKIPLGGTWDIEEPLRPSLLDIDMNSHVNNLNYIRWTLSFMSGDFCTGKLMRTLDTNFISSAKYGEDLICRCAQTEENVCIHSIIRVKDGSEVFRARTEWADEKNLSRTIKTVQDRFGV